MVKEIPLRTPGYVALVDDEDYERLSKIVWYASPKPNGSAYAFNPGYKEQPRVWMHREVISAPKGLLVDHINHNGLDNRKDNLRLATNQQNQFNSRSHKNATSKYKGVSWDSKKKKWRGYISINKERVHLGWFDDEETAVAEVVKQAKIYYGEFANV
jgi:hypothetical protein